MDVTVPFHVCWNVWGPVHSSILFWNIPSTTSMLPSWFARMVHYNLQYMVFNLSLLVKALTICPRSQTYYYYGRLNLDWLVYIVHVKLPLGKLFLSGALRKFVFKPASKGPYSHKACPLRLFTLHVKHGCTISGVFERGHYHCWADIRFFQYPLVLAIRQFIIYPFQLLLLLLLFKENLLVISCNNIKK